MSSRVEFRLPSEARAKGAGNFRRNRDGKRKSSRLGSQAKPCSLSLVSRRVERYRD